ncbi:MAG TPA: hypothetical protein VNG33_12240, partial [Polyangiaceae bacterium]|nr:hypothetical protein [Polyangiaceae bacterium]
TTQSSGGAAAMSDEDGGASGANACPESTEPGLPVSAVPSQVGCYEGRNGVWEAVPCSCDLWVDSPRTFATSVSISLSFTPANLTPSLDGDLKVEMEFPDAGGSWFEIWQRQAAQNLGFIVTHSSTDDTTTVRLGQSSVTLAPVPLVGCESRHPRATVAGPWGTELRLDMVATLSDRSGNTVTAISNECAQPAGHPTFAHGGAAGASP